MASILLALGMVLIVEGLVFAIAPHRVEDLLKVIAEMPPEARRLVGLIALTAGAAVVAISTAIS